jgi:ABC-2 type transport system permease protein
MPISACSSKDETATSPDFALPQYEVKGALWGFLYAFAGAFVYQAKHNYYSLSLVLMWIFSPLIFGSTIALLYRTSDAQELTIYAILGAAIFGIWNSSLFLSGLAVGRERWLGTMELHLASPARLGTVMLGKGLANGCQGLFSGLVAVAVVTPISGRSLDFHNPAELLVSAVLSVLSISAFAMCVAPLFFLARGPIGLLAALDTGVIWLSGTLYPLDVLPRVLHPVAWFLPTHWGTDALVRSAGGAYEVDRLMLDWLLLAVLAVAYALASRFLFRLIERYLRSTGALSVY